MPRDPVRRGTRCGMGCGGAAYRVEAARRCGTTRAQQGRP
eukprot:gene16818-886_t